MNEVAMDQLGMDPMEEILGYHHFNMPVIDTNCTDRHMDLNYVLTLVSSKASSQCYLSCCLLSVSR